MRGLRETRVKIPQPKITEESVVKDIVQYLAYQGIVLHRIVERIPTFKNRWGQVRSSHSTPGMPDLVGYIPVHTIDKWNAAAAAKRGDPLPGAPFIDRIDFWQRVARPVFIEVKRPGGKRRPRQELFIAGLLADGITAFFADSIVAAVKGLQGFGYPVKLPGE